jgi:hypothetical protein
MAQGNGENQGVLIEPRRFACLTPGCAALFDDAVFERDEVMLLLVTAGSGASQMSRLAMEPKKMGRVHRVLHRLEPITMIDLVLLDPALAVLPGQNIPTRQ